MNVIWLSLVLKLKRVTRSVPRTIISMPNIFLDRCAQAELPHLTGTLAVIKDTDFLKSYSRAAAREKREDAFRDELGVALLDVLSQKGEAPVAAGKTANLEGERPLPSIARFRTASISDARGGNKPRCART